MLWRTRYASSACENFVKDLQSRSFSFFFFGNPPVRFKLILLRSAVKRMHTKRFISVRLCDGNPRPTLFSSRLASKTWKVLRILSSGSSLSTKHRENQQATSALLCRHNAQRHVVRFVTQTALCVCPCVCLSVCVFSHCDVVVSIAGVLYRPKTSFNTS